MQFNSILFLFGFLPLCLILYRLIPARGRGVFLVAASFVFYGCNAGAWAVGALAGSAAIGWLAQRHLARSRSRCLLTVTLLFFAGVLTFCKIYGGGIFLTAGMSFYLFQLTAVMVEVYRGKLPAQRLMDFLEQIAFFPKLLSGPLVAPADLARQQKDRNFDLTNIYEGLRLLILGLSMKVLLANRLGGLWSEPQVIGYSDISTVAAWMALIAFAMELFLDFWGYSLMAMGIGRMFGYRLPENFLDPYTSRSVSEFYRRWHASLGAWFREYVYFPLGGSRRGTARTLLNLTAVWLFTGFWHGVGGNYILWAMFLLVFIGLERLFLRKWLDKSRVFSRVYVLLVILLSWVPFAVGDFSQMCIFLGRLFGLAGSAANPRDYVSWLSMYAPLLIPGGLLMTGIPRKFWQKYRGKLWMDLLLILLFWMSVYAISTAAQDPFLYFQY